jgi:hypothetical protein
LNLEKPRSGILSGRFLVVLGAFIRILLRAHIGQFLSGSEIRPILISEMSWNSHQILMHLREPGGQIVDPYKLVTKYIIGAGTFSFFSVFSYPVLGVEVSSMS